MSAYFQKGFLMNAQQMIDHILMAYGEPGSGVPGSCNHPPIEALPAGEWEPLPGEGTEWCPMTFNAENGVPDELGSDCPVLERDGVLFIVTDDGFRCGHSRFRRVH